MFGFLKKKQDDGYMLGSPAKGKAVDLKEVNDPTFNSGMLGQGVAVIPSEERSVRLQTEKSQWFLIRFMQ